MEARKKVRLPTLKGKISNMLGRKRGRLAHDKMNGVKETPHSQLSPLSASENSELSNCETTVDLPKPQYNQTIGTSMNEQSSTTSGQ